MPRRNLALGVAILVAAVAAPSTAAGTEPKPLARYCSPTGDLCFGVVNRSGAVSLEISTFARYFDRYLLCVEPLRGASTCRSFPVRKVGAFYISRVRWYRNFPARGPGVYRVSWKLKTNPLGPRLRFRLPLS